MELAAFAGEIDWGITNACDAAQPVYAVSAKIKTFMSLWRDQTSNRLRTWQVQPLQELSV